MVKRKGVTVVRSAGAFAAIACACLLPGCTMSDDTMARFLVAPDKYATYTCAELAAQEKVTAAQERDLRQLMAKASDDSTGRLVSAVAYNADYLTAHGELRELRQTQAAKNCGPVDDDDRVSDTIIR
jgi:hypothetical protein